MSVGQCPAAVRKRPSSATSVACSATVVLTPPRARPPAPATSPGRRRLRASAAAGARRPRSRRTSSPSTTSSAEPVERLVPRTGSTTAGGRSAPGAYALVLRQPVAELGIELTAAAARPISGAAGRRAGRADERHAYPGSRGRLARPAAYPVSHDRRSSPGRAILAPVSAAATLARGARAAPRRSGSRGASCSTSTARSRRSSATPTTPHVPEPTRALLIEVAQRYGVVACVSGRRAVDRAADRRRSARSPTSATTAASCCARAAPSPSSTPSSPPGRAASGRSPTRA